MDLHWELAVFYARRQFDLTYEEWCKLYYNHKEPTQEQILTASETAKPILVRNGLIQAEIKIDLTGRM